MEYFLETSNTIKKGVGFSHYDETHLFWLAVFLIIAVACCVFYKKCSEKGRKRMRIVWAFLLIADELYKMTGLFIGGNYSAEYLPLHLCSINIFLIAIHAFQPIPLLGQYLYAVGIPGTMMALLFPTWTKLPLLNFMHIHSFTVHILLEVYPLMLTYAGEIKPRAKNLPKCVALLLGMAIPVYIFNLLFDTNFMFLMDVSKGNPLYIFETVFGHHWVGFPVIMAAVFAVMYIPPYIYRRYKNKKISIP